MDGGAATYAHDGEGRRMKKTTSAETTYTFYGPGGILCEFSTVNTGATAAASTDRTLYQTSERTGTAVLLFTTAGTVIENNRTLPYGEAWLSDVASANDKKFTTYDRDKESGLDYAMARMYANTGGRFTSPDQGPISLKNPRTLNRYAYGTADPVNLSDPTGNFSVRLTFIAGGLDGCYSLGGVPYIQGVYAFTAAGAGSATSDDIDCEFPEPVIPFDPSCPLVDYFAGVPLCMIEPEPATPGPQAPTPRPAGPTCDVRSFASAIGTYTAAELNAITAVIMGEGTGIGLYGQAETVLEYAAIGSVVMNRADASGRGIVFEASQRRDGRGRLQFQGYTAGAATMAALQSGDTAYFLSRLNAAQRRSDPNGYGAFRAACEKFGAAVGVTDSLARGIGRLDYTYFNQSPGPGRTRIASHYFRTGRFP